MHSARLANSDRLQRVYDLLLKGPKTTREIIIEADVCAVNTIIDELRDNNIPIVYTRINKTVYQYSLENLF